MKSSWQRRARGFLNGRFVAPIALSLAVLLAACSSGGSKIPERIILIVVDTLRRDYLSCYGSETPTPDMDALAKKGQIFTNAHSSFHQTTMSMASLFTGHTPSLEEGEGRRSIAWNGATWCGLVRFTPPPGEKRACLMPTVPTLAELMHGAGYWTIGVVSNASLYEPAGYSRGFDDWSEIEGRLDKTTARGDYTTFPRWNERKGDAVNRAAMRALKRRPADRFFLYVHYMDPHDYWLGGFPYAKGVVDADYWLGRLLAHLKDAGLLKDAVVVVTADHGERLGEKQVHPGTEHHDGNPSFEQLLRVPLIISPARFEDPTRLVRSDDVFRMLKEIAGIPNEGKPDLRPEELFVSEIRWMTYRMGRWKSFQDRVTNQKILIDLGSDPGETTNVAAANTEVMEAHLARTAEIARALASAEAPKRALSEQEKARLRSLGYLQ